MDEHAAQDKNYHALIAEAYDYITNDPRQYPNELLFRPIDRKVRSAGTLLDLGCGTGQMFIRYGALAENIIAVDHSPEMLNVARRKASTINLPEVAFIEQDLHEFLELNRDLRVELITCVGVIHHLQKNELQGFLQCLYALLTPGGQCVIAEPIYSESIPRIVSTRNAKSILPQRLKKAMPNHAVDPDEEPLHEQDLLRAIDQAGFSTLVCSKGFELFHVTDPITFWEKLLIQGIYWRYRNRGDVLALLLERP